MKQQQVDKSEYGIVEEQAQVIKRMSDRLGEMERKNEEYLLLLRQLSLRVFGEQDSQVTQASEEKKQQPPKQAGGVLVSALIEEMNQA